MRYVKCVLAIVLLLTFIGVSKAAQRNVLAELITNTGCSPCYNANLVLDNLVETYGDNLVVIRYHAWWPSSSDPFYQANIEENSARINYYGADYAPHLWIDGTVDGTYQTGTWNSLIQSELTVDAPLTIDFDIDYNPASRTGQIIVTITNEQDTGTSTLKARYVVVENNCYYPAPNGEDIHNEVMRDFFPSVDGVSFSVGPYGTFQDTAEFTISSSWNDLNCQIVVFVQDDATKRVHQAKKKWLIASPFLSFARYRIDDATGGNGNRFMEPGEQVEIYAAITNTGRGTAPNPTAILSSQDPYISVITEEATYDTVGEGEIVEPDSPFAIQISSSTPLDYLTWLQMTIVCEDDTVIDSIPILIAETNAFSDDMESGEGNWTHSGTNDTWHLSTNRNHSPTHSWYCGLTDQWHYNNNVDAYLESRWVVVPKDGFLSFWNWYSIEQNSDYGYVEIFTGSIPILLQEITGSSFFQWINDTVDLTDFEGSAVKIRFRFVSNGSVFQEGWYIDDVELGGEVGIEEGRREELSSLTKVLRAYRGEILIMYSAPRSGVLNVNLYDVAGRALEKRTFKVNEGSNMLRLKAGNLSSGIYFLSLNDGGESRLLKLVYIR